MKHVLGQGCPNFLMDSQIGLIVVECGPIKSTNIEIKNQENFNKLGDLAVGKGEDQKKVFNGSWVSNMW